VSPALGGLPTRPDAAAELGPSVTLANWQDPPFNRWGFLHVDAILPTAAIGRQGAPTAPLATRPREVIDLPVAGLSSGPGTAADVLAGTETDAFLILQDGVVVHESYGPTMTRATRHLLMSVSKSFIGGVAGILAEDGRLDLDGLVTDYVPEVIGFGYQGATVRNLLDMRSGISFSEAYLSSDSDVSAPEFAASRRPYRAGMPTSTYDFLARLPADRPHGGGFRYRSCETDMLGWVCERAGGADMATMLSRLLWQRLGMADDAYNAVDLFGVAVHNGGLCATARDVARFGQLLLDNGRARSGEQVLPPWWTPDVLDGAADGKDAFTAMSADETGMPGGHYRHQLWVPFADRRVVLGVGIYGQMVYVDQDAGVVGVKLSSWPVPQSPVRFHDTLRTFRAIAGRLGDPQSSDKPDDKPKNDRPTTTGETS
jgi:CubicO group peptidase (beta-lactamase class C family)